MPASSKYRYHYAATALRLANSSPRALASAATNHVIRALGKDEKPVLSDVRKMLEAIADDENAHEADREKARRCIEALDANEKPDEDEEPEEPEEAREAKASYSPRLDSEQRGLIATASGRTGHYISKDAARAKLARMRGEPAYDSTQDRQDAKREFDSLGKKPAPRYPDVIRRDADPSQDQLFPRGSR